MAVTTVDKKHINISIGVAVVVIMSMIVMAFNVATWKAEIHACLDEHDDRITHIGQKIINMRSELIEIQTQASGRDIQLAEINTKLSNIESLLLELRTDMKNTKTQG